MGVSVDELIALVSQWSPGFSERIQGATPREVQVLTELVGFPLSEVHVQFLLRMGHGDGGAGFARMDPITYTSVDIAEVIDYYRARKLYDARRNRPRNRKKRRGAPGVELQFPPHSVLLETGGFEIDTYVEAMPGYEPRIIQAAARPPGVLLAESLTGYLARRAFVSFRLVPLPYRLSYSSRSAVGIPVDQKFELAAVRGSCLELGFVEEWFSDVVAFCGERDGTVVLARQGARSAAGEPNCLEVYVSSPDIRSAREVGDRLCSKVELFEYPGLPIE